jgi:hypothetical protein
MGIINRRNAMLGWAVWQVLKQFVRMKARQAVPGRGDYAGLNKSALATIVTTLIAAVGGFLLFWRKKSGGAPATT